MGRRIRSEGQMLFLGRVAQVVENYAGLNPSNTSGWIDFEDFRHVPGEIQNQRNIAALSGEQGSATTT